MSGAFGGLSALPAAPVVVIGYFDVLRLEHVRALEEVRQRTSGHPLVVLVRQHPDALMSATARAAMVAALRMVDYVVTADDDDLDSVLERLRPAEVVRLEEAAGRRIRDLIEHVQRGQTR